MKVYINFMNIYFYIGPYGALWGKFSKKTLPVRDLKTKNPTHNPPWGGVEMGFCTPWFFCEQPSLA